MTLKRAILTALNRQSLKQLIDDQALYGVDRRSVVAMRLALSRSRRVSIEELLTQCREDELKAVCEQVELPTSGNRDQLIQRLLNGHAQPTPQPSSKP